MPNFARILYYLSKGMGRLRWDEEKLVKYQNKQLRKVVKYAFDYVPFYHELYRSAGVRASDIKSVGDLNKLPIVRKTDMRKRTETDLVSREFNIRELKVLKTGGATGEPFAIYISDKEDDWRKAIYIRANLSCGQRPRDRWVAIVDAERAADTTYFQRRVGIFAQTIVPVIWSRAVQLKTIEELKPDILDGFSGILWLLARAAELRGVKSIRPRIIFGSADLIDRSSRDYLEEVFGAPYYDQFGCTEIDRSAWQCLERIGYHMDIDSVIMQFVDEEGEEVGPEERGEIVYTSLFNYAMPFIRYDVQDVGVTMEDECPCGKKLPLMKVVEGRNNSFLVFPGGHIVTPMSFIETMKAFRFVREIAQYRVVQDKIDLVEIYVKKADDKVDEESLRRTLITNILEGLPKVEGIDLSGVSFEVKFVDDLPLAGRGKLNVVVSNVKSDLKGTLS